MQFRPTLLVALVIGLVLGSRAAGSFAPRDASALLSPSMEAGPQAQEPDPEFKRKFQSAIKVNSKNEAAKLVKDNVTDAVAWIVRTGEQIADGSNEELETFMTWIREAWKTSLKSEFAERTYSYFTTIDTAKKKNRKELKSQYEKLLGDYRKNLEAKEGYTFKTIAEELDVVASGLEQEGDYYLSSEAWNVYATCFDVPLRGSEADLFRASKGYTSALEMRDKVDLKDKLYEDITKRKEALAKKGADKEPPPAPPPAEKEEPRVTSTGQETTVPLTFEPVADISAFQRPHFMADEIYPVWLRLGFGARGTTATFDRIPGAPVATRDGSNEVKLDCDGDGKRETKIPLTGNIELVRIKLGAPPNDRPWAFLAATGQEEDRYQNIQVNMHPSDNELSVYTFGAASVVGTLNGVHVRINDDDMDAIYGNIPRTWGHVGLTRDNYQPEMDSILLANGKRARPWSEVQEIGGAWYKLGVSADGKELRATPMQLETGLVKLKFTGPAPTWLVLKGSGDLVNSYFDIAEGGQKGVALPSGKYSLYYGEVRKGKKLETMKSLILPGKSTPTWDVNKGETTTVALGGPFGFAFHKSIDKDKVTLEGNSIVITGAHGERYERPWNCAPRPEVSWRKKGSKKASKPTKLDVVLDTDAIDKYGWPQAWSPLDHTFDVQVTDQAIELQLTERKNELLGKIESEWKE